MHPPDLFIPQFLISSGSLIHDILTDTRLPDWFSDTSHPFQVETAGDCYIAAAGILGLDEEGFLTVTDQHEAKVWMNLLILQMEALQNPSWDGSVRG